MEIERDRHRADSTASQTWKRGSERVTAIVDRLSVTAVATKDSMLRELRYETVCMQTARLSHGIHTIGP